MAHHSVSEHVEDLPGLPPGRAQLEDAAPAAPQPVFELTTSPRFAAWLAAQRANIAFTT